jgi:DNA-binding XRE family transcriptional regulator
MELIEIGQMVQKCRKTKQWTQPELARRVGVSRATIAALENGKVKELGFVKIVKILMTVGLELRVVTANLNRPTLEGLE